MHIFCWQPGFSPIWYWTVHPQANLTKYNTQKKLCEYVFLFHRPIVVPVTSNGCEIWSLTLQEEQRLKVFYSRMLRRIFVPKR
jgi:hypothetical protein